MTSLHGRDEDLAQLRDAARASRLVTVVGPVGVGKTQLARALLATVDVARVSIDLSERTDDLGLRAEVARALGADAEDLEAALGREPRLVMLDNLEQLVEAGAPRIAAWLGACPALRVVATSRRRLAITGERVFELAPLRQEAAEALFVDRARQADRGYAPDREDRAAIAELVRELDYLPLAIELAAARARVMTASELLARIHDRFGALASGPRDAPSRHASLEGAIASSWTALGPAEQRALAQCAVFEGGFDLAAAEAVVAVDKSALDALGELVDRSLLVRERVANVTRYRLLASVREYARAHGDPDDAADRHAAHYLAVGLRMADRYERRRAHAELEWLIREDANLSAVLRRALEAQERPRALAAALALQPVLMARGPARLRQRVLDRALERVDGLEETMVAWAHLARGDTLDRLDRAAESRAELERALSLAREAGDRRLAAVASWRLGASLAADDFEGARAAFERALEIVRASSDRYHEGRCLSSYAAAALESGRLSLAAERIEDADLAHVEARDATYRATTRALRGRLMHHRGELAAARDELAAAIAAHRALDTRRWLPRMLAHLGLLELEAGDLAAASEAFERGRVDAVGRDAALVALLGALIAEEEERGEDAAIGFASARAARSLVAREAAALGLVRLSGRGPGPATPPFDALAAAHLELTRGGWDDRALTEAQRSSLPLARLAARRLSRALDAAAAAALVLGPEARWFRLRGGERVSLARRAAPRRLLRALADTHADPERWWSLAELFERGWPSEKALEKAAASRVYVAVSALRKAGLEGVIDKGDEGYRLRPDLRLLRATVGDSPK